jgi:hypothetical protein
VRAGSGIPPLPAYSAGAHLPLRWCKRLSCRGHLQSGLIGLRWLPLCRAAVGIRATTADAGQRGFSPRELRWRQPRATGLSPGRDPPRLSAGRAQDCTNSDISCRSSAFERGLHSPNETLTWSGCLAGPPGRVRSGPLASPRRATPRQRLLSQGFRNRTPVKVNGASGPRRLRLTSSHQKDESSFAGLTEHQTCLHM